MKNHLTLLTLLAFCAAPALGGDKTYGALEDLRKASPDGGSGFEALQSRFTALAALAGKQGPETDRFLEAHQAEAAKFQAMKVVHPPIKRGWCSMCHVSAEDPAAMRDEVNVLCQTCHNVKNEPLLKSHMGVTSFEGKCTVCHDPHASAKPKILRAKGEHGGFSGCTDCHTKVSTDGRPALPDSIAKSCFECHPNIEDALKDKVVHGALQMGACTGCHNPHFSERRVHLRAAPQEFCMGCHNIPAQGHPFGKHRSFKDGGPARGSLPASFDCTSCHMPHSSVQPKLLKAPRKELCLNCHKM